MESKQGTPKNSQEAERLESYDIEHLVSINAGRKHNYVNESKRKILERQVNIEKIRRESKEWQAYLIEKVFAHQVVLLGEAHTLECVEKDAVTDLLGSVKQAGMTDIGLEIEENEQAQLDHYAKTGKFLDSDNPKDYELVPEYLGLKKRVYTHPGDESILMSSNFFHSHKNYAIQNLPTHYALIKRARELGIRIHAVDANQKNANQLFRKNGGDPENMVEFYAFLKRLQAERDRVAVQHIREIVADKKQKMLVLFGASHLMRGALKHENIGDILKGTEDVSSFTINVDRDLDRDPELASQKIPGVNINSVFRTALDANGINNIGFDLDPSLFNDPNQPISDLLFDGFIKL